MSQNCTKKIEKKMETTHMGLTVYPTPPTPKPLATDGIPERFLKIMAKYKYNWRLNMLSIPKRLTCKFIPKIEELSGPWIKTKVPLSAETAFYTDQMARPLIRHLEYNKKLYKPRVGAKKFVAKMNKKINYTWNSMYNYYKQRLRLRMLRQKRLQKSKRKLDKNKKAEKEKKLLAFYTELSKPKIIPKPAVSTKPKKIFANYNGLDVLAAPKIYEIEEPKSLEVSAAAMTYEISDNIRKMAAIPKRWLNIPKPLVPGQVNRNALRYNITPRIEAMAVPKVRSEKNDEDNSNVWVISKNALKYKATERIINLAKPVERD